MTDYKSRVQEESDAVVNALLKLPVKNLESRIKEIVSELKQRQRISDERLSGLGTHRLQVLDQLHRLRYLDLLGVGVRPSTLALRDLLQIEQGIAEELTACFRDALGLKEKLQDARESLETSKQKLKLIEFSY